MRAFGDCIEGQPGCEPDLERSSSATGEVEVGFPLGDRQWFKALLSGGSEWLTGTDAGAHQRGTTTLSLADNLRLTEVSIHRRCAWTGSALCGA